MAELPTKEDLEKLYREKGHDALVWYAWRNALRALPVLGKLSIERTWSDHAVENVFAISRVLLVLAQFGMPLVLPIQT